MAGEPTLGEVYWDTWGVGARKIPYSDLAGEYREHTERAAAAVGAAAIARLQREEPQAALALDIARDEITSVRNVLARVLAEFKRSGSGHSARLGQVAVARAYRDGGLPVPADLAGIGE
jgi:hypothetical protein